MNLEDIAIKYRPIIYFHRSEKYFPCSLYNFIEACNLVADDGKELISNTQLKSTPMSLLPYCGVNVKTAPMLKIVDKSIYASGKDKEMQCIFTDPFTLSGKNYFYLIYTVMYGYNGTRQPHEYDQEYATCLFQCNNYSLINGVYVIQGEKPIRYYYSAHGQGIWFRPDQIEYEGTRFIVYASSESHSMYPTPERRHRLFRLADDVCGKDIRYDVPETNVVVLSLPSSSLYSDYFKNHPLYYFHGRYVDQTPFIFYERRTNPLLYDGQYKFEGGITYLLKQEGRPYIWYLRWLMIVCLWFSILFTFAVWHYKMSSLWNFISMITMSISVAIFIILVVL